MRGIRLARQWWGPGGSEHARPVSPALGSVSSSDEGMTLIELMWALMIFAIAATAIAYGCHGHQRHAAGPGPCAGCQPGLP